MQQIAESLREERLFAGTCLRESRLMETCCWKELLRKDYLRKKCLRKECLRKECLKKDGSGKTDSWPMAICQNHSVRRAPHFPFALNPSEHVTTHRQPPQKP